MAASRVRPFLYVFGVLLIPAMLVGSRFLAPGSGRGDTAAEATKSKLLDANTPAKAGSGPVVIGYVDSFPQMAQFGLPPTMQSGMVANIFVKEGDEVPAGAPLLAFDSTLQEAGLRGAKAAVLTAEAKLDSARAAQEQHQMKIGLQE